MNKDNEKQLLTTGVYEAPKCEVVEMMGEGALIYCTRVVKGGHYKPWGRRGSNDDEEEEF